MGDPIGIIITANVKVFGSVGEWRKTSAGCGAFSQGWVVLRGVLCVV